MQKPGKNGTVGTDNRGLSGGEIMVERNEQIRGIVKQLRVILKEVLAHSKNIEKSCGLSNAKFWMLREIDNTPGIQVSQLATALSIHPSTCSNTLNKIEKKHLVYRDRSKTNQRNVHLHITEEGRQILINNAPKTTQGGINSALEQLSPSHLARLERGLDALVQALHGR